jgi:hypothetical protein
MRFALWILSLALAAGSGCELYLTSFLPTHAERVPAGCAAYLCEEDAVIRGAYDQQASGAPESIRAAAAALAGVLERNPAEPMRWADAGSAWSDGGDPDKAQYAFARALELGLHSTDVLIYAGDYYLRQGNRARGLEILNRTLTLASNYDEAIFSRYQAVPIREALDRGVPAEIRPAQSYLRYLMREASADSARELWRWMGGRNLIDTKIAGEYAAFLLNRKEYERAAAVWRDWAPQKTADYQRTEFIYNPGFEAEPGGSPFDWRISPIDHVEAVRDGNAHRGAASLRVTFDGEANTNYGHVAQSIVLPAGRYRLRAWVRAEGITTDQGVLLGIRGLSQAAETEALKGTSAWHAVEVEFEAGPGTRLLEVVVARRASWRFDSKIKGSVWVDDVSVERR